MEQHDIEIASPKAGLFGGVETRLLDLAEDGKAELVRSLDGLVLAAHEFAARIDTVAGARMADYVRDAAGMVENIQSSLRDKPVGELLDDGRDLIRTQPAVAIGLAATAGFLATRLFKALSGPNRSGPRF